MARVFPAYLRTADIQDPQIRFLWDDWNVEQAEEPIDPEFMERLQRISQRAVVAFVTATAEWIVYRFAALTDVTLPLKYIESAWAQVVDWRYGSSSWEESISKGQWTGPVCGPVGVAITRVAYAIDQARDNGLPELRGAWIENLAAHVMSAPAPYREWRDAVVQRCEAWYPRDSIDTLGDVVPAEALDADSGFRLEHTESVVNEFLKGLDYRENAFLSSPAAMIQRGFRGTPYQFDIEQDRRDRNLA